MKGKRSVINTNQRERKETVFSYLDIPIENRLSLKKFLKLHRMQKRTFFNFEGEYKVEKLNLSKQDKREHQESLRQTVMDSWTRLEGKDPVVERKKEATDYNSEEWLKGRTSIVDKSLIRACEAGNAQALKIYFQLTNRIVEKQETKVIIDGGFIARAIIRAESELGEGGFRMAEMQEELSLLPPELCLDTGQSKTSNH